MDANELEEWRREYDELRKNPPTDGDRIYAYDAQGNRVDTKLTVECVQGKEPFISTRAALPQTVGAYLEWQTQSKENLFRYGWKCILLPKARNALIAEHGLAAEEIYVYGIKVVRRSDSGTSFLCEVDVP
jgi:hypothetical protein